MDRISEGILVLDAGGRVRMYNRQMEVLTGYRGEEMNREGWHRLFQPTATHQTAQEGEAEWTIRSKDGQNRSLRVLTISLSNTPGEPLTLHIVREGTGEDAGEGESGRMQSMHKGTTGEHDKTILLVDDDPTIRELGKDILGLKGYQVLTAENGIEALQVYQEHDREIALIILDMVMPKMSGRETFHALRKLNPELKIILSSGYSQEHELRDLLEQRVEAFIPKPYNVQKFLSTVETTLGE